MELTPLERLVLAAFEQAVADGRLDVADCLLTALELIEAPDPPGRAVQAAYAVVARGLAPPTGRRH